MKIRLGYEMVYSCPQPTPTIMTLNVHSSRVSDLLSSDYVRTDPPAPQSGYRDGFGNWVTRVILPVGETRVFTETQINDSGEPDPEFQEAQQHLVEELPDEVLVYLLGSRYCETDILMEEAWRLFDSAPFGWLRVQAICDFVHQHISFGYEFARPTKTAAEVYREKAGVWPRLYPSGDHALPLHEYSSSLLCWIRGGHRKSRSPRRVRLRGLVRSLS